MVGMGRWRSACSGLRRSGWCCVLLPEEGGESSGDWGTRRMGQVGRGLGREKDLRTGGSTEMPMLDCV